MKNLTLTFYESIRSMREAERRLAEANVMPQDLDEYRLQYEDIYTCPAGDGLILDNEHAFISIDGRTYHNDQCAEVADLMKEQQ